MSINDFKPEVWTSSSNGALKVSLVTENAVTFSPQFTYPIYGDSEQIFGYKDLTIHLVFDAITLKPFVNVKYSQKLDEDADDIEAKLLEFLPKDDIIIKDEAKWISAFEKERIEYALPPDKFKISEYKIENDEYVVYKVPLGNEQTKKMHLRIQILSLLYIEAASYIEADDPNWEIVWSFNKNTKECAGYVTTYRYWKYKGGKNFDENDNLKYRGKISQFLVLPPYQGKGHGSKIYSAIYNNWLTDSTIAELTVEDPNESFDDLRDRCDLTTLYESGVFESIPEAFPIDETWIDETQQKFKVEKRQFNRLVEMMMLKTEHKSYGLQVKKRLYIKNYDALVDMEDQEKKDALEKSFLMLDEDYKRILSACNLVKRKNNNTVQNDNGAKKLKL
ncbi:hypothetical protein TPHA_0D00750 [Tetrapisispora phaffii CBS 4417]|uniref:Histone acetyltransferase type B catalytic subunit n=1 Tax=Tetrapisispora phaffii (strain ATCC 24235 / CBS 4417 / NBRC 1672 / NRRL Y-8282 / UCD 70-5) TaxID=1071381 RepID=G8BS97_TETPH|nr:hypothetical protein TPHA_0D00750 [Tetrapisispora phaffii CBS 4417]CCE62718.1 hypothetical protein TPHA_0D00750 [Tetrapisispora phaffii CBS 4417]